MHSLHAVFYLEIYPAPMRSAQPATKPPPRSAGSAARKPGMGVGDEEKAQLADEVRPSSEMEVRCPKGLRWCND